VKAAAIGGISAGVAAVIIIGVFIGIGENKDEQPTEYERTLQESVSSESIQPSEPQEPTDYVRELEESVSSESTSQPPVAAPPEKENNCEPSYPDVCIPSYPPDLDCGQIDYKNFKVVGSDPHGFDRDNDGIGCE
jgi:hypothetical protein